MLGIVGDSYDPHKPVYGDGRQGAMGTRMEDFKTGRQRR